MKKLMALVLSLVCILALCSCGRNSQKVVAAVISENVTQIDHLREWLGKLSFKYLEVKEGQSPGDSNGSEVYTFVLTGDESEPTE